MVTALPVWRTLDARNLQRWLESLETQAAQNIGNGGRLSARELRDLLDLLQRQGWRMPRGVETNWVGGPHINIIGPSGQNIHLPVPPGFTP